MYGGVEFRDYPDVENIGRLDFNCLPLIHSMQTHGIRVDIPLLQSIAKDIKTRQAEILNEVDALIGDYQYTKTQKKTTKAKGVHFVQVREPFNIGSPDAVAHLLFRHLQVQGSSPIELVPSHKRESTSDDILEPFAKHPVVSLILEWRELDKIRGTYAEPLQLMADSDSRIHTRFNPTVASTGRLSSSNPNLMNIPVRSELGKKIRFAFLSSPNCTLVSADLSQIEMRWAAHGSGDPTMIRVFHEGLDIHATTACNIFGRNYNDVMSWDQSSPQFKKWKAEERAPSKNLGFGVLYGLTAPGLQRNIFNESSGRIDWTEEKCQGFIDKFFTVYPGLRTLMDIQHRRAQRYAMVWDAFGRPRMVPEGRSVHTRVRNEGLRKAGNHYEQSSAQGTIKLAMAEIHPICEELCQDYRCFPLVQVHDQLIFDVDNEIAQEFGLILQDVMQKSSPLDVPVLSSLDTAERWGEL